MKLKRVVIWSILPLLLLGGFVFVSSSRAGYESAAYEVVAKSGSFEVRAYEALTIVSTAMTGEKQNRSFGKLFGYISGGNADEEKIAMTTPVFMPSDEEGETQEMQFVVPAAVAAKAAPAPSDPEVRLSKREAGRYAALRFGGVANAKKRSKKLAELRELLAEKNLTAVGDPIFAGYDPPWTPGPLRRNEVLVPIAE